MSPFRRSRRAVEMCIAQRLLILSCLSRVAWAPAAVKGFLHGWSSGGTETGRDACDGGWLSRALCARGPLLNLVEFQISATVKQHARAIQTLSNDDSFTPVRHPSFGTANLKPATVPADRPVVLHRALFFEDEHVLEAQAPGNGAMVVDRAHRAVPELVIDALEKLAGKKPVCRREVLDAPQPHLLDETVLEHAVPPFDPALGLRTRRRNDLNSELVAGLAEGRQCGPAGQLLVGSQLAVGHVEILVVGVKRPRDAVELDPPPQHPHGPFGGLLLEKPAPHLRRGVVYKIDQARLVACLEPVVEAPVHLHELAEVLLRRSPSAVRPPFPLLLPQPLDDQPPTQRLVRNHQPHLGELLGRQSRPKPFQPRPAQLQTLPLAVWVQLPIRRPPSSAVHQALGPLGLVPLPDPLALPPAHRKPLGCRHHRLPPRLHLLELHQPRPLLRAQPHDLLHPRPPLPEGTLLSSYRGDTFMELRHEKSSRLTGPQAFLTIHRSSAQPASRRKAVVFYIPQ